MAISSAMYAAVTGLSALGTGMQTISNNIANVNTVGFKAGRTNYEDLISQNYFSGGKVNQRGTGVKVSTIQSMFTQGAFMSSAQDTDMAIAGEGFFSVRNPITGSINYTRAGVFTLTKDGLMEDPSGNILQGWQMSIPKPGEEAVRIGAATDVKITVVNAPPVASSRIKVIANLDASKKSKDAPYKYEKFELAVNYAHEQAEPKAESARNATIAGIYPTKDSPMVSLKRRGMTAADPGRIESSKDPVYDASFLLTYKKMLSSASIATPTSKLEDFKVLSDTEFLSLHGSVGNVYDPDTRSTTAVTANANGIISESQFKMLQKEATGPVATFTGTPGSYTSATNYVLPSGPPQPSGNPTYDTYFLELYNKMHNLSGADAITSFNQFKVVDDASFIPENVRKDGWLRQSEFDSLVVMARAEARAEAQARGRDAYNNLYNNIYDATYNAITSRLNDWQLEGNGFAGAWNAQETPYIDSDNYIYPQPLEIYDTLGEKHKLMVYYQPNPHMDNVWDYIITCDPLEDARKDSNNNLLFSDTASFSGLIQKGKITFSADGKDRHGGLIKDIEAQNIDLERSKMATIDTPKYSATTSSTMRNAKIGGYYKGSPIIDPYTGQQVTSARTYTVKWGGNVKGDPVTSGMVWEDDLGNSGIIPVYDKQFAGPYTFGSGMTITFDTHDLPLRFGGVDTDIIETTAHSEQIAWTNLQPNKEGYFDFDVAFVQSASMALHPPYPEGMPTIYQKISFDMGAKNPYGLAENWELDKESTTQYAAKSSTFFANSDGYGSGSLQRVSIGEDGVITGIYSNGRQQPLYQIGLTRFLNPWGLSKLGDNLFEETRYSGEGAMNEPGAGGTGTILANFLEQSNVDIAEEIVNMIVTQRGFQANSKTVTTTDSMLAEVIEMKR